MTATAAIALIRTVASVNRAVGNLSTAHRADALLVALTGDHLGGQKPGSIWDFRDSHEGRRPV